MTQEYLPSQYRSVGLAALDPTEIVGATRPGVARRLRIVDAVGDDPIDVTFAEAPVAIRLAAQTAMTFGTEVVTIGEYFKRVLLRGDLVDLIVGDAGDVSYIWIHIDYEDTPTPGLHFSAKDDGLFALRARAGEKAERMVRQHLESGNVGHLFDPLPLKSDRFVIRYHGKKARRPDLRCVQCGLKFEVKKRNRDRHFRISHSDGRPFWQENAEEDWHAFVFPDRSMVFVPNSQILGHLESGMFTTGADRYDAWADIHQPLGAAAAPRCPRNRR
jgi:hypothetical protein